MRLHFNFVSLFVFIITVGFFPIPVHSQVVAEFGSSEITLDEFEHAYAKNVGGWEEASKDSLHDYKNFMDLYIKFKMKLRDAKVRGYDKDENLMKELNDYQKQVGVSYIIEKQVNEPGLRQLYDRRNEELRVNHIMIRPDSLGDDAARNEAQAVLDSIKNGASYEEMALRHSDDKFSAINGGDIYYITAGILPYEFEDAMYSLQPGQVYQEVIKTRYGYHIIKVTGRQPRIYKLSASHILISYFDKDGKMDSAAAKLTADSVAAELKAGKSFEELAKIYSDDTGTKDKGGDLGYFERRMMVKEFDEAVFNLKPGEISDPVQTNFGYHIIKSNDIMETPSFEEDKENLRNIFNKQRYQFEYDNLISSLRAKYNYTLDDSAVDFLIENSDSIRFGMIHPKLADISQTNLFAYSGKNVNIGAFLEAANQNSKITAKPMFNRDEVVNAINLVNEELLLSEEAMHLHETNSEFAALMSDYRDGIFIFKLQEDEVWSKMNIDSTDIYNYWEENKDKYSWPDRISFSEIFSTRDSLINKYYSLLKEGADFDSLASLYTERPAMKQKSGNYDLQDVNFSDFSKEANKIQNVGDFIEPIKFSGGYSIFKLNDRQPARLKAFEEAKAEASGDYQEMLSKKLESDYIKRLEDRYHPKINYDVLEEAFTAREDN